MKSSYTNTRAFYFGYIDIIHAKSKAKLLTNFDDNFSPRRGTNADSIACEFVFIS